MRELIRKLPAPVKRTLKEVRSFLRRPMTLAPEDGGITRHLLNRYCQGAGVEIGPGVSPYGARDRTIMVERYAVRYGTSTVVDILADATELPLQDESVDYLISAHMLEHHHDPLTVLDEWRRVLRDRGHLFLVLPHGGRTWDRGRQISTLDRLREVHRLPNDPDAPLNWNDYERVSLTVPHLWMTEPEAKNADATWNRRWLVENSKIHYHVWTQNEMVEVLQGRGFEILAALEELPERLDSFVVVAAKSVTEKVQSNDNERRG